MEFRNVENLVEYFNNHNGYERAVAEVCKNGHIDITFETEDGDMETQGFDDADEACYFMQDMIEREC